MSGIISERTTRVSGIMSENTTRLSCRILLLLILLLKENIIREKFYFYFKLHLEQEIMMVSIVKNHPLREGPFTG